MFFALTYSLTDQFDLIILGTDLLLKQLETSLEVAFE
jgi:hypothetical protein